MIIEHAPAKLNLTLHILGKRADGYHEVESLVAFAALGDTLEVEAAPVLSLAVDGEFAAASGAQEENLVLRAARLLQAEYGVHAGAALRLTKRIPVGAGLGGGSADAAAALRALNQLWQLALPDAALMALAPKLGADVAMCIASRPAIARGIGEKLEPLAVPLPALHGVLVHPRTPLLTKEVYAAFALSPAPAPIFSQLQTAHDFLAALKTARNDLEPAALTVSAEVGSVRAALVNAVPTPALVRMSGSGACCYGLYTRAEDAARAAETLAQQHLGWWVQATALCI